MSLFSRFFGRKIPNKQSLPNFKIADQWTAASTLMAGIIQRLESSEATIVYPALEAVSAGDLVQVELMMIFSALQRLHDAGRPLTHDSILNEVRTEEPRGAFGFACMTFEDLWHRRPSLSVSDDEFSGAVTLLSRLRVERNTRSDPAGRSR